MVIVHSTRKVKAGQFQPQSGAGLGEGAGGLPISADFGTVSVIPGDETSAFTLPLLVRIVPYRYQLLLTSPRVLFVRKGIPNLTSMPDILWRDLMKVLLCETMYLYVGHGCLFFFFFCVRTGRALSWRGWMDGRRPRLGLLQSAWQLAARAGVPLESFSDFGNKCGREGYVLEDVEERI